MDHCGFSLSCCPKKRKSSIHPSESSLKMGMGNPKLNKALFTALEKDDIVTFKRLMSEDVDLEHKFNEAGDTLLIRASLKENGADFLRALLEHGANPNAADSAGFTALHCAMMYNLDDNLALLLADERTDVNAVNEYECTALHYAAQPSWNFRNRPQHLRCITLLMSHPRCQMNRPNVVGETPISMAVGLHDAERIKLMLTLGKGRIDVDYSRTSNGKLIRRIVRKRFPELEEHLPPVRLEDLNSENIHNRLLAALQHRQLDMFKRILSKSLFGESVVDPNYWYEDPYYSTLVELACRMRGGEDFVQVLLDAGANPNTINKIHKIPLIHQAMDAANYPVLEVLIQTGKVDINAKTSFGHTVMHVAAQKICSDIQEEKDIMKCLEVIKIQSKEQQKSMDINAKDTFGDTALHDAAYYGNKKVSLFFLRLGANIIENNGDNEPPLVCIDSSTLETYLDEQLDSNGLSQKSSEYQLILKYNFLIPRDDSATEMYAIQCISQTEDLRHLLKHPILTCFLYLKWYNIRRMFFCNIAIYLVYVILLTLFILIINAYDLEINNEPDTNTSTQISVSWENTTNSNDRNATNTDSDETVYALSAFLSITFLIFLTGIVIRELFQFFSGPCQYVRSAENILEVVLIICTLFIIFSKYIDPGMVHHISAIAILLSWAELILLTGRLPLLALQLEMFWKVAATFLRFMAWYSLIIVAFSLSFHTLFSSGKPEKDKDAFYLNPVLSILKTVVMMSGEFEASNLRFDAAPYTSHIVFLIFVFMVAIVLLNLLSGLAVYDTQAIKEDAEIFRLVSMVRVVCYMEGILVGISKSFLYRGFIKNLLSPKLKLFNDNIHTKHIHAFKKDRTIKFLLDAVTTERYKKYKMEEEVLKAATDIITNKSASSELDELKETLSAYIPRIESIEKDIEQTVHQITDIRDMLSSIQNTIEAKVTYPGEVD